MKRSCLIFHFSFCICFATACYDNAGTPPARSDQTQTATLSIGELVALCPDHAIPVTRPIVIGGTVTSSDEGDNFYRSLTLQDDTGGVELMCGIGYLYRDYPPGTRLSIRLQGLAIGKRMGVTQIGFMPPTGDYAVDYIASKVLIDKYVARGATETPPTPELLAIPALTPAHCGSLIKIADLTLLETDPETEETSDDRTWSGYRIFTDPEGREIRSYTSSYARYATREIPRGALRLTGILQKTGDTYTLKMRDESDCTL